MKKLLLPVLMLGLVSYAGAQCSITTPGKYATAVYDDFSGAAPSNPDNSGVYAFGEDNLGGDANPNFQATYTRDNANGELDYVVTQGAGEYVPFGLGFGDSNGDGSGTPFTIDLSGDATYSVTITNNSGTETIRVRMTIQDVDGDVIDTDAAAGSDGGGFANAWKYTIEVSLTPGETKTMTAGTVNSSGATPAVTLSGTYEGGYYANYTSTPNAYEQNVDFTQIKSILFTVTNSANSGAPNYTHNGVTSLPVSISEVKVGACPASIFPKTISNENMSIVPNPATDIAKVSYTAKAGSAVSVNVSDVMGNIVKTVEGSSSAADVNVADLNKGVYFVTVLSDGTPVSAQKLVVE